MSDTKIICLLVMPYSFQQMFLEVSAKQKIMEIMDVLIKEYQSQPLPLYFYLAEQKRVLDTAKSLESQGVGNGDVLYWI